MGHKTKRSNYRVVVELPSKHWYLEKDRTEEQSARDCQEIIRQIKRHVDEVGEMKVIYDAELFCEHCDSHWTEGKDSAHNGGCCAADCEVYESSPDY